MIEISIILTIESNFYFIVRWIWIDESVWSSSLSWPWESLSVSTRVHAALADNLFIIGDTFVFAGSIGYKPAMLLLSKCLRRMTFVVLLILCCSLASDPSHQMILPVGFRKELFCEEPWVPFASHEWSDTVSVTSDARWFLFGVVGSRNSWRFFSHWSRWPMDQTINKWQSDHWWEKYGPSAMISQQLKMSHALVLSSLWLILMT